MNEMPWWGIVLIIAGIFCILFVWMLIGHGSGEFEANVFLISVLAFGALIYGAYRWAVPRQWKDGP